MQSIWERTKHLKKYPQLSGDCASEATVIGGGMAGILTAWFLQKAGIHTIVLEASRIGSGQTAQTTAKITSQHNLIYDSLINKVGREQARQYAHANQMAIKEYYRMITKWKIDCDFKYVPAYLYSELDAEPLIKEAEAAQSLGIEAAFTVSTALPFDVKGAMYFRDQAMFHPLKFLSALAEELEIYEETRVLKAEGNLLETNHGNVKTKHVIFACHYPFLNHPGYYFLRMHQERSYVLALKNAARLDGVYLGIDPSGNSFRNYDEYLLFGGGGHRTGENTQGGQYRELRSKAKRYWPESIETANWSAQDCMSLDEIPYIGNFSASTPDWYVATGFQKWGMTSSMTAAVIISDMILGRDNPDRDVFSPQRYNPSASMKNFFSDGIHAAKDLGRRIFTVPDTAAAGLKAGTGGVVEYEGKKAGVYKREDGKLFSVDIKCPHLGCQLAWNPDEKSWDCPCHGSRFDYQGRLLDSPAQEDVSHE